MVLTICVKQMYKEEKSKKMSEFGKTVDEANKPKTKGKFSSDYLRITNEHQTVIRVLDVKPEVVWSHFVPKGHHAFPKANAGKGGSFTCLGFGKCPICEWNKAQKAKDEKTKDVLNASKKFTFNVLDRTNVVTCTSCGAEHYEVSGAFPSECECGADMSNVSPAPRNKIQIMSKGKRIVEQLQAFEADPDFGDLRGYDIKLDTKGKLNEAMTTCVPRQKTKLEMKKMLGEDWETKLFNIKEIVAPLSPENIERILVNGEDFATVLGKNKESS